MTMPDGRKKIHVNLTDFQEPTELAFKPSERVPGLKAAEEFQKRTSSSTLLKTES